MKACFLPLALTVGLVVAFGAIAAACGDDGDNGRQAVGLQEYFLRVETLVDDVAAQSGALGEESLGNLDPASSEQEQIEAWRPYLSGFLAIMDEFLDEMDEIDPPAEVEGAHKRFVEAAEGFAGALEEIIDGLDDVRSRADLDELLESPSFNDAGDRVEQACFDVQDVAEENGIDVDLNCALRYEPSAARGPSGASAAVGATQ